MQAAIIAGGRGLRMGPATDTTPKPMLPVAGKPLLEHQLLWLKSAGFAEVFLCLGYKAEVVKDYFKDGAAWGLALRYTVEAAPRGTAGAVRDIAREIKGDLLVVYGDLYLEMDCRRLLDFHARREGAATLVLRETDHPADSDLARLEGDRVTSIYRTSTPEERGNLGLAAVWVVRPSLMRFIPEEAPSDFGRDVFPKALAAGEVLRGYRTTEVVADLGTPQRCEAFGAALEARVIISRTPFRVSFAGGGTDLAEFYRGHPGAVVSTAIDKYMYITVNRYFDDHIILKYSKTELVSRVSEIRHPILRECLRKVGLTKGVEVTSMADVVGGTGLGSSSSFTVGVLHALHAFKGEFRSAEQLAREACEIEIGLLKEPIGKQDQYIAAYGGFQYFEFLPDETVRVDPVIFPERVRAQLSERLILLYTGVTRSAGAILRRQRARYPDHSPYLKRMRELAEYSRRELQLGMVDALGELLHEGWELKKKLADGISNPRIDRAYAAARKHGALGGKILGAGGGGFLLLFCPPPKRPAVLRALRGWREIPFKFEPEGSKIIYVS